MIVLENSLRNAVSKCSCEVDIDGSGTLMYLQRGRLVNVVRTCICAWMDTYSSENISFECKRNRSH